MFVAISSPPWRALKPFLIAGAAALTWLTISASGASADPLDATSLHGQPASQVSAIAAQPVGPAPAAPSLPSAVATSAEIPAPAFVSVQGATGSSVSTVPVLNHVAPAGTGSAISIPAHGVFERITPAVSAVVPAVRAVVAPIVETGPAFGAVLQPARSAVTGTGLLPPPRPAEAAVDLEYPRNEGPDGAAPAPIQAGTGNPSGAADAQAFAVAPLQSGLPSGVDGWPVTSPPAAVAGVFPPGLAAADPGMPGAATSRHGSAQPLPAPVPVGTSAFTGSSGSPAGSSGTLAWTDSLSFQVQLLSTDSAGEPALHVLTLVSSDPGSSPD